LIERGHEQRFDEVFQLVIVIGAILVEFIWTFQEHVGTFFLIAIFALVLTFWAVGTLKGGRLEYRFKLIGFQTMLFLLINEFVIGLTSEQSLGIYKTTMLASAFLAFILTFPLIKYLGDFTSKSLARISLVSVLFSQLGFWMFYVLTQ